LRAFSGFETIKKVPKKGEYAAMQDSARQEILFSFIIRSSDFVLSRGYVLSRSVMIYLRLSRPGDGSMSLSFWMGSLSHDGLYDGYTGLESACGFFSRACLRADGDG